MKKLAAVILTVIMTCACLCACGSPEKEIAGVWNVDFGYGIGAEYTFDNDGSMYVTPTYYGSPATEPNYGKYVFSEETLDVTWDDTGSTVSFPYEYKGGELIVYFEFGDELLEFEKIETE